MSSDDETAKAIEGLDGHTINGRSIVVKEAEDRGNSRPQARSFDSNRPRRDDRPQRAERTYTPPVKEDSPFMNEREDTSTSEPVKKTKRGKGGKKKVSGPDNSSESREKQNVGLQEKWKEEQLPFGRRRRLGIGTLEKQKTRLDRRRGRILARHKKYRCGGAPLLFTFLRKAQFESKKNNCAGFAEPSVLVTVDKSVLAQSASTLFF
jgi:hypothetical protein